MNRSTTIHFVRHGEVHNPDNIYYGRLPGFHLSAEGVRQASVAANVLKKHQIAAIYSSPLERTIETAEVIARQLGLPLKISDLLIEVASPVDGQPLSALEEFGWNIYTGYAPTFEQPIDVLNRVKKFALTARQEFSGQPIAAITHGDLIAFMVQWAQQLPIDLEQKSFLYQSFLGHASISSFTFQTDSEAEIPRFENTLP